MSDPDLTSLTDRLTKTVQAVTQEEKDAAESNIQVANQLILAEIAGRTVPDQIVDQAILEVGSDLYFRRTARNGVMNVTDTDLQPFRINRDPLAAARPILRPFIPSGMGIA
jgi:hypothetical protein